MQWFKQLETRERYILILGAIISVVMLIYALVWRPLVMNQQDLTNSVIAQQANLAWMQNAANEIRQLRQQTTSSPQANTGQNQSLLSAVDTALNQSALAKVPKRIEPQGDDSVRVLFDDVSFSALSQWLADLYNRYSVQVATSTIERLRANDRVKVRLLLFRGTVRTAE
ncbi:type II secretory pathway, component PulM [Beggiatoa alba B18LD]|uniref:Type II secretion system protein M n=1 Tax=Beggiatoa alba B18LD TaxID=395493 RepID=I3CG54_9GAMM|nr:type II secretion system protein M [Beggiatoa alba]EIJ42597.1 type II secretory pathway, component PulM [Beggiatoa alba B18LD]